MGVSQGSDTLVLFQIVRLNSVTGVVQTPTSLATFMPFWDKLGNFQSKHLVALPLSDGFQHAIQSWSLKM